MESRDALPSEDDLRKLSHRALVAYAARRARRMQPDFWSHSPTEIDAVEQAIAMAERFAKGEEAGTSREVRLATEAARNAMEATNRSRPKSAAARAFHAVMRLQSHEDDLLRLTQADALDDQTESLADYGLLVALSDEALPGRGAGIDFDQLGPLWPNGEPPSIPTEHVRRLRNGIEAWNEWRQENPGIEPDLSGLDLVKDKETRASVVDGITIRSLDLSTTNLKGAKLADIKFKECNFQGANLGGAALPSSKFTKCYFYCANLDAANISEATFHNCQLSLNTATSACSMDCTEARGTSFLLSDFRFVNLNTILFDEATNFHRTEVADAKISRQVLDTLEDNGGLTQGRLRDMTVVDDIATLRQTFSGLWRGLHYLGLFLFLAPYLWFLASQWTTAALADRQDKAVESAPVLHNLIRFVASGGETLREWQPNSYALWLAALALAFNVVRGVLVGKTMLLEQHHRIQGHYPTFDMSQSWMVFSWGCFSRLGFLRKCFSWMGALWKYLWRKCSSWSGSSWKYLWGKCSSWKCFSWMGFLWKCLLWMGFLWKYLWWKGSSWKYLWWTYRGLWLIALVVVILHTYMFLMKPAPTVPIKQILGF